ncbi:MAG: MerR family DNA-binding transcriptional regulator [Lachnospiraceae bacterium]
MSNADKGNRQNNKPPESTLRYYEKKGLLQVKRNKNGIREYEESGP